MKINVVVLDDSPLQLLSNCNAVNSHPNLTLVGRFTDIAEAIMFLNQNRVDLLLTDVEMPVLNGFQVMEKIPSEIHVIMNSTRIEFAHAAFGCGADAFLTKPIQKAALFYTVEQIFNLQRTNFEPIPACGDSNLHYSKHQLRPTL